MATTSLTNALVEAGRIRRSRKFLIGPTSSTNLNVGTVDVDNIANWSVEQIKAIAVQVAGQLVTEQIRRSNPPTEIRLDGSANKQPIQVRNNINVSFGTIDARPLMANMERIAAGFRWSGQVSWVWIFACGVDD